MLITKLGYGMWVTMLAAELASGSVLLARRAMEKFGAYVLMERVGRVITLLYFIPVVFGVVYAKHQDATPGYTFGMISVRNDNAFICTGRMWLIVLMFLLVWAGVAESHVQTAGEGL